MSNPFVIPLGLAFIAGALALLVDLVRRIANFSARQEKAVTEKGIPREEARRNAVLFIACGIIVLLALVNLSVTYVKAFRHHSAASAPLEESALRGACEVRGTAAATVCGEERLPPPRPDPHAFG